MSCFRSQAQSLDKVRSIGDESLNELSHLECISLYCTPPPQVTSQSPREITAEVGDVITLKCDVKSELPATIFWTHHNKILDGEHSGVLTVDVDVHSIGAYKCYATSLAGNGSAAETVLKVCVLLSVYVLPTLAALIWPALISGHLKNKAALGPAK